MRDTSDPRDQQPPTTPPEPASPYSDNPNGEQAAMAPDGVPAQRRPDDDAVGYAESDGGTAPTAVGVATPPEHSMADPDTDPDTPYRARAEGPGPAVADPGSLATDRADAADDAAQDRDLAARDHLTDGDDPAVRADLQTDEPAADRTDEPADADRTTEPAVETGSEVAADRDADAEREPGAGGTPPFHEPAPQDTAFGAATVGGAVAASALAGEERQGWARDTGDQSFRTAAAAAAESRGERPGTGEPGAGPLATEVEPARTGKPGAEEPGAEEPWAEEPSAEEPWAEEPAPAESAAGETVPAETVPAGTTAGETALVVGAAAPAAAGWTAETAQGLRDRFREVQMRFVDDPQGAVGEAETLVDEAFRTLVAALEAQKDELDSGRSSAADDTERLRVILRNYRDFLTTLLDR